MEQQLLAKKYKIRILKVFPSSFIRGTSSLNSASSNQVGMSDIIACLLRFIHRVDIGGAGCMQ